MNKYNGKKWEELLAEGSVVVTDGVLTKFTGASLSSSYDFVIGQGVTSIQINAFSGCERLKSVSLPKSLRTIGERAFLGCYELTSITIPDGVTSIGNEAFSSCTKIAELKVPSSVTEIGYYAFSG